MPQRDHSNVWPADPQATADQDWQRLVEQRLPADLQAQACELKAFVRARGLPSALVLLRGLLYYVLSHASLRNVSVWSRLIGLTSRVISGQAWDKRLTSQCRLALVALQCASRSASTWLWRPFAADPAGRCDPCLLPRQARGHLALALCLRPAGGTAGLAAHQHPAGGRRLCSSAAAGGRYRSGRWSL